MFQFRPEHPEGLFQSVTGESLDRSVIDHVGADSSIGPEKLMMVEPTASAGAQGAEIDRPLFALVHNSSDQIPVEGPEVQVEVKEGIHELPCLLEVFADAFFIKTFRLHVVNKTEVDSLGPLAFVGIDLIQRFSKHSEAVIE